jgi:hypothetical protein
LAAAAAAAAEIECLSFKKMNMTMLQPNYTCQLANFEKYTFFSFLRRVGFFIFGLGRGRPWASPVLKGARAASRTLLRYSSTSTLKRREKIRFFLFVTLKPIAG